MNYKKSFALLFVLVLTAFFTFASAEPVADFATFSDYGKVLSVQEQDGGAYIVAEGYYGYHLEDEPSVTVGVTISSDGLIMNAVVLDNKEQTPGFPEMITAEFVTEAYQEQNASDTLEVDGVSGATVTWTAIQYAVQTASYYAQNALGYVADTDAEEKAELNAVYPAAYTTIQTEYAPDEREQGLVLYAAEGVAADGTEVVAMKVRGSRRVDQSGSPRTGWDAAMPGNFTMVIVVDKAENEVIAWEMLRAGTRAPEYFAISDEIIDIYTTVKITAQDVYDEFEEGLIKSRGYETESSPDGSIITGTTIVYTGTTEQGEFGAQMVRNCFKTAAYFYNNYAD